MRQTHQAFQKARAKSPWTKALLNPPAANLETKSVTTEGRWPVDLNGTFFRTGPAQHERDGERYSHWFDGDGMIEAYQINSRTVSHKARMIETPKYRAEERVGRFLRPTFGTPVDLNASITGADDMNVANINVLPLGDNVLALWEGGSATSIDASSLATKGFHDWTQETKGLPFSAHYKIDPDGTIWNFGTANFAKRLMLYHISPQGELLNVAVHPLDPNGMIHDFIVTEKHLIIIVPPLHQVGDARSFIDSFKWQDGRPSVGLVFDKEKLELKRRFELPSEFHFHFGNAWEDNSGTIHFDYCSSPNADFASEGGRKLMRGEYDPSEDVITEHYLVHVDTKGRTSRERLGSRAEFPRTDPRRVGLKNTNIYTMWGPPSVSLPFFSGVAHVDLSKQTRQTYAYGPAVAANEHVYVPSPRGSNESEGWLIGTTLDLNSGHNTLNVFEASNIAAGPIALAHLDYGLPMGLHGAFKQA